MSKKLLAAPLIAALMAARNDWMPTYMNNKELEGSAIYIPKRHKYKRRNKR